jgi:hypothetical protein
MIKIDQAFVQAFINGSFGLTIAHENDNYEPTPGTPYAEIYLIPNDITPVTLADSDETDGVFRINLRYPSDTYSITAKTMADSIFSVFKIGTRLSYDGQKATITGQSRGRGINEGGWYALPLSIAYRAFLPR